MAACQQRSCGPGREAAVFIDRGLWPQLCDKASYCLHPVLAQQQHQQVSCVLELEEVWPLRPGVVGEGS